MFKSLILIPIDIYDINGTSHNAIKIIKALHNCHWQVSVFNYFAAKHLLVDYEINSDSIISINKQLNLVAASLPDDFDLRLKKINELNHSLKSKINFHDYNLVIDMTAFQSVDLMHMPNYAFVQQYQPSWYATSEFYLHGFANPLNEAANLVLYDQYQLSSYDPNKHYFFAPLSVYDKQTIINCLHDYEANAMQKYNGNIVYIGRINQSEKNIGLIDNLNRYYDANIQVYGPLEEPLDLVNYHGKLTRQQVFNQLTKSKYAILVSNTEGFSYSLVEAISTGTPVIIRNSFPAAKFLTSQHNGFLFAKNATNEELSQLLKKIMHLSFKQYDELVHNNFQFALTKLSTETFDQNWKIILNYFTK